MASHNGQHVPGTRYKYRHGWIPRSASTLNVGLHVGDPDNGGRVMSEEEVTTAIRAAGGKVTKTSLHTSDTEPTLVVSLKHAAKKRTLHNLSKALHQDAIAQRHDDGSGDLEGPKAADWGGAFNAEYFLMHDGKAPAKKIGPTNAEKIHNAEVMYGTGSKQHKAAMKKFGSKDLSIQTPWCHGVVDLANDGEQLAYWKQVLPKKTIHYTGQDGERHTIDFTEQYLTDLANNKIVDEVGFLLADKDNRHTMDPERWRGKVAQFQVRDDGLYAKIVFPNKDAAAAVLANPDLGVSARIIDGGRELADGSSVSRGIVHVLGTLDPQVNGMSGWTAADLSTQPGDVLDLTTATFEEKTMALFKDGKPTKAVADFTDEEVESLSDEDLELFLAEIEALVDDTVDEDVDDDADVESEDEQEFEMALSNEAQTQIDLANSRANTALRQLAQERWGRERDAYLASGVPPALLDLAAPVLSTTDEFVVDLSRTEGDGAQVNVEKIVRGLLDAAKGTIDLSAEEGHGGTFKAGSGEDPDAELLKVWDETYR